LITGEKSWFETIERRRCEDCGGEFWEYRKPIVEIDEQEDFNDSQSGTLADVGSGRYSSLSDGFYWIYCERNGQKIDVCLVKLYNNPDSEENGIGYGIWDGCAFMPLTDIADDARLERVEFSEKDHEFFSLSLK
jgi:hypothetical protein